MACFRTFLGLRIWHLGPLWHLFHPLVVDHVPYVWRAPLDAIGEGAHCGYGLACARAQLSLVPALMLRRSKIADSVRECACLDMSLVPALMLRRSKIADSVRTQRVCLSP